MSISHMVGVSPWHMCGVAGNLGARQVGKFHDRRILERSQGASSGVMPNVLRFGAERMVPIAPMAAVLGGDFHRSYGTGLVDTA